MMTRIRITDVHESSPRPLVGAVIDAYKISADDIPGWFYVEGTFVDPKDTGGAAGDWVAAIYTKYEEIKDDNEV